MFCVALSKVQERSELGVLGYPERLASLLVDLPRCMRHRKASTCDRSMGAAGSIGYLAHPDLQPLTMVTPVYGWDKFVQVWLASTNGGEPPQRGGGGGGNGAWHRGPGARFWPANPKTQKPTSTARPPLFLGRR
jgi:hypothetical protein